MADTLALDDIKEFLFARHFGAYATVKCDECNEAALDMVIGGTCGSMYRNDCASDLHARHLERDGYRFHVSASGYTVRVVA